jgi:hypothetical protein
MKGSYWKRFAKDAYRSFAIGMAATDPLAYAAYLRSAAMERASTAGRSVDHPGVRQEAAVAVPAAWHI